MSRRAARWTAAGLVAAAAGWTAPAIAQHPDSTRALVESMVWGGWPTLPWDRRPAAGPDWAAALNRPLPLGRAGRPDDTHRYRVRRTNVTVDREGRTAHRQVVEGEVVRRLVREAAPGRWAEAFEWTSFAMAQAQGDAPLPPPSPVPAAHGLAYTLVPGESDYVNLPADFSRAGGPLPAMFLKLLAIDATTFDALLYHLRDRLGDTVRIGDVAYGAPFEAAFEIGAADRPDESETSYRLGEMRLSVAGLSRWGGEPTVVIWFSAEGSEVNQHLEMPQLRLVSTGIEFFRGQLALSLLDGRIVAGTLWGPVVSRMSLGLGTQPLAEQPTAGTVQQVTLQEIGR